MNIKPPGHVARDTATLSFHKTSISEERLHAFNSYLWSTCMQEYYITSNLVCSPFLKLACRAGQQIAACRWRCVCTQHLHTQRCNLLPTGTSICCSLFRETVSIKRNPNNFRSFVYLMNRSDLTKAARCCLVQNMSLWSAVPCHIVRSDSQDNNSGVII